mmetsp:Transcript_2693/g.2935  ORF Transcript_2693/g.2935 Transcript_2693/m.2935 type:complete len:185 (-) Transcript_2693:746-1300(-)
MYIISVTVRNMRSYNGRDRATLMHEVSALLSKILNFPREVEGAALVEVVWNSYQRIMHRSKKAGHCYHRRNFISGHCYHRRDFISGNCIYHSYTACAEAKYIFLKETQGIDQKEDEPTPLPTPSPLYVTNVHREHFPPPVPSRPSGERLNQYRSTMPSLRPTPICTPLLLKQICDDNKSDMTRD